MNTIKTDSENVSLTLGEHLCIPYLEAKQLVHVSFMSIECASSAVVDVTNRRIIWLSQLNRLTIVGSAGAGGKVKNAMKAYNKCYGENYEVAVLLVNEGVVTSLQAVTQKHSYSFDWKTGKQVVKDNGWKY